MKLGLVVTLFNLVDIPQSGFIKTKMNFFIGMQMKVFAKYILTVEHFYHYCPRKIFPNGKLPLNCILLLFWLFSNYLWYINNVKI